MSDTETTVAPNNDDRFGATKTVRVYSPKTGEAVDTSNLNAHDLVTHLGWSRSVPVVIHLEPEKAPVVVQAPEPPAPTPPPVEKAEEGPVDLTAMSRAGLVRYAKEKFGIEVHGNTAATGIIAQIEKAMGAVTE